MEERQLGVWLRRLRVTATVVFIAALCGAVAVLVIAFIPGSPVVVELNTTRLSGLDGIQGVVRDVIADPAGRIPFRVVHPSLGQRLLYLATTLPGVLLIAEIARRMSALLRSAEVTDPFTTHTVRELTFLAKLTAFGGFGVSVLSNAATSILGSTILASGKPIGPYESPLVWLAVGLVFAGFAQLLSRGVAMRADLDTVI
ncbi:MAG: hypothetical protein QOH84_2522 [Kribbellaceae bacterium]|nr:hypothetical protein [Kribbellaceae bacterium]